MYVNFLDFVAGEMRRTLGANGDENFRFFFAAPVSGGPVGRASRTDFADLQKRLARARALSTKRGPDPRACPSSPALKPCNASWDDHCQQFLGDIGGNCFVNGRV